MGTGLTKAFRGTRTMIKYIVAAAAGATIGGVLGYFGKNAGHG
jgi:hypothetical protein